MIRVEIAYKRQYRHGFIYETESTDDMLKLIKHIIETNQTKSDLAILINYSKEREPSK